MHRHESRSSGSLIRHSRALHAYTTRAVGRLRTRVDWEHVHGASTFDHRELEELAYYDISMKIIKAGHELPVYVTWSFHRIRRPVGLTE